MIVSGYISHYKSISDATIYFNKVNVIVGANGVGKSNVIDALYFIRDCISEDLDTAITKRHGIESIRQWSKTRPYNVTIELHARLAGGFGRYRVVLSSGRGDYKIAEESGDWSDSHPFGRRDEAEKLVRGTTSFKRDATGIVEISSTFEDIKAGTTPARASSSDLFLTSLLGSSFITMATYALQPLARALSDFVSYSIYPNTLRDPQVVSKEDQLLSDGSNLGTILKRLNSGQRRNKEALMESMRLIMPYITDISVRSTGGYYVPAIRVKETESDPHDFNMSQISDGTLRVLGLLTAFYQPNAPSIIALEEPEQMVHPGVLPLIADAVHEFVGKKDTTKNQVFITTHSPTLLDLFEPESLIWTTFSEGVTRCGRIGARQRDLIKTQLFSAGEILLSEGFYE
jgi:predicted ATPase